MAALQCTESIDREQIAVTAPSTAAPGVSHVRADPLAGRASRFADHARGGLLLRALADPMAIRAFVARE